jgi:hypothetical protein
MSIGIRYGGSPYELGYKIIEPRSLSSPRMDREVFTLRRCGDFLMRMDSHGETVYLETFYRGGRISYYFWDRRNGPTRVVLNDNSGADLSGANIDGRRVTLQEWEKWRDEHREVPYLIKSAAKCD